MQSGAIRGLDGDAMPAPPTDALLRAAKPRVLIGAAALLELLLDHLQARSRRLLAPAPKRAGPRRPISVSGAIAAESCQHFVTIFGDYSPMTRDENLNAMIQELRECSGLPAACMKAAKIEWPRPLALGRLARVAIANAPSLTSARLMSRSEPQPPQQPALP